MQANGKILVGGGLCIDNLPARNYIERLNSDGSAGPSFDVTADATPLYDADPSFDVTADAIPLYENVTWYPDLYPLAIQPDGEVLVGGYFTSLSGQSFTNIGRLNNTEPATQSLAYTNCGGVSTNWSITWLRGGSAPEIVRATFDLQTNATDWVGLGDGVRIPGGWQLVSGTNGMSLSSNSVIRARGYVSGGAGSGASWFFERSSAPTVMELTLRSSL